MPMLKKSLAFSCLLAVSALLPGVARAEDALHVVRSGVNAESENAEFCLEFDKTLAPASSTRLAAALRLEAGSGPLVPQNIVTAGPSLCLFPLERGQRYTLDVTGLRGAEEEKMAAPYRQSFIIPNRSPALAFTADNGGVNGFSFYEAPLDLRTVNVARVKLEIYRVSDVAAMAHVWQDRAQTALAPSESVYLAHNKGQKVWESDDILDAAPNATVEQKIVLSEKAPNLGPGLYLIVADAGNDETKNAESENKGLAPLAAAWFVKSDFSIDAVRDEDGVHVFAAKRGATGPKTNIHLIAADKTPQQVADAPGGGDGIGLIPYPQHMDDKGTIADVIATDDAGNVAFADIETLPALAAHPDLGAVGMTDLFATPGGRTGALLSMEAPEKAALLSAPSVLRLSRGAFAYTDFPVAAMTEGKADVSFIAPAIQGAWVLRWQKNDNVFLADAPLRVTVNPDAPRLEAVAERDILTDGNCTISIQSVASSGKPAPLAGGHITVLWQKLNPSAFGWQDYRFGTAGDGADAPVDVADFLTDLQGKTQVHIMLPAHPQERGLYQAVLHVVADADSGIADAPPVILPLRPEATVIGVKPLAAEARFPQNGIARFSLIGLSSDGKPRDVTGLSYQLYEEGRSFDWYQDGGNWKYKPEAQLRPIGGGALSIKADASSVLEWPVTAGNYRLEILDQGGKVLAQTMFSAGWDSSGATMSPVLPLALRLPKVLQPGSTAIAHVTLTEPSMLTAIVADTRIRHVVHEFRPKGDNEIAFTPGADWKSGINLIVEAEPQNEQPGVSSPVLRGVTEASIAQTESKSAAADTVADAAIAESYPPATLMLRKDMQSTLVFGIENLSNESQTYHYAFTATPGLGIEKDASGSVTLGARQSEALSLLVSGDQLGAKELKLDVASEKSQSPAHISRSWNLAVLPKADGLRSVESIMAAGHQSLITGIQKARAGTAAAPAIAFVSRKPMDGLAEILSFVFNAQPFTTAELALNIDALRQWSGTLAESGLAPDFIVAARQQEQIMRLLRRQNADGGFAALRDGESTMEDTAAALTALGPDMSDAAKPAKALAIGWIKQRLANTWFNEKERDARAAAYAALAAADAIDPSSLHYFSDTSATLHLPVIAEANIAAAFKHIRDPDAAAFWIKKMLNENPHDQSVGLLNALAATDALSSDDVHAAMAAMTEALRKDNAVDIKDAAGLLRAIATDNADAGKGRVTAANETHNVTGVMVLRLADAGTARNDDAQPLAVTFVAEAKKVQMAKPGVTRHIYRMNGVELQPPAKPLRGEAYMVELKGSLPDINDDEKFLLQEEGGIALRPIGCPLPGKLETPAFIPWFTMKGLTPTADCEFSAHALNVVLTPEEDADGSFSVVYFAMIDAGSIADLPAPQLRILK